MGAIRFRVGIWLRREWRSVATTALVLGLVGGMALALVAGTRRTESAPDRYTRQAGGDPDLFITQGKGPPLLDEIARVPGVTRTKGFAFVLAFPLAPKTGEPLTDLNPFAGNDDAVGARAIEGRFTDPKVDDEFTVSEKLAALWKRQFGTKVGDRFTFAAFSFKQLRSDLDLTKAKPAVTPFTATMVGVTESPSDFDEDSVQLIFSKGFLRGDADVGVVQTLITAHLTDGVTAQGVLTQVRGMKNGRDAYTSPLRIVSDGARRAVRFQTVALWLVSALVIAAACVIGSVVGARALRVGDAERSAARALGWSRRELAAERALEGAAIGLVAVPLALGVAYAASALFPLGALQKFEPDSGLRADWLVLLLGALAVTLLGALVGAVVGHRVPAPRVARPAAAPFPGENMPLGVGIHFATVTRRGNRAWTSVVVGAVGIAGVVGAAVAGTSLTTIVQNGDRWGLDFDELYGNPYAPADRDIVTPIVKIPHVASVTGGTIGSVTVNGNDVATFAYKSAKGDLHPTVIEGRDPVGDREIGLGAEVTRQLKVGLGDMVRVGGSAGTTRKLQVVGIVVTPDSAGGGAALPFHSFQSLNPDATQNIAMVDYQPGAPASAHKAVAKAVYSPPDSLEEPTTVRALERVAAAPFLLCTVFGLMLLVGGAYLLGTSVRGRARDFGTLRAMGTVPPQSRAVVHWQASVVALAMTLLGVPFGLLVGHRVVSAIVTSLGIVPGTVIPWWLVAAAALLPLLIANVVAGMPARRASRPSRMILRAASG